MPKINIVDVCVFHCNNFSLSEAQKQYKSTKSTLKHEISMLRTTCLKVLPYFWYAFCLKRNNLYSYVCLIVFMFDCDILKILIYIKHCKNPLIWLEKTVTFELQPTH